MDLESRIISEKNIKNSSGSITWANDNKTIFYNMKDSETLRSERVMRFKLGDNGNGSEVYFEEDETFSVFSYKTKTEKYIVIGSSATLSQEYRIINAEKPDEKPKLFQKRVDGLEYSISHFKDKWFITTNKDDATNFKLMTCPESKTESENWVDYIKHRQDVLLGGIEVFDDFLVISERENGLRRIGIRPWDGSKSHYIKFQPIYH